MAKVIVTCGRLSSGKTTYAKRLSKELPGVLFSVDDITLLLLGPYAGNTLNEYCEKLETYFLEKSAETAKNGVNCIIDIGLWTKAERERVRNFFKERGVKCEIHYLKVSEKEWKKRIENRNREVENGRADVYCVDENLLKKFETVFEEPSYGEEVITVEA